MPDRDTEGLADGVGLPWERHLVEAFRQTKTGWKDSVI
jgi:hypothetical protein